MFNTLSQEEAVGKVGFAHKVINKLNKTYLCTFVEAKSLLCARYPSDGTQNVIGKSKI
jgi:hypothetical protein